MSRKFSVVIPSFNRAGLIPYTLKALQAQTLPPLEVIVVLKPTGDGTEAILDKFGAKTLVQTEGAFTHALNMGVREVRGEIIAFTDSDAIPEPDWLERLSEAYDSRPDAGGVSGAVIEADIDGGGRVKELVRPRSGRRELLNTVRRASFDRSPDSADAAYLTVSGYPLENPAAYSPSIDRKGPLQRSLMAIGANMSARADVAKKALFDERLVGAGSFNEAVFSLGIQRQGYRTYYSPNAIVFHLVGSDHISQNPTANRSARFQRTRGYNEALAFFLLRSLSRTPKLRYFALRFGWYYALYSLAGLYWFKNPAALRYGLGALSGVADGLRITRAA